MSQKAFPWLLSLAFLLAVGLLPAFLILKNFDRGFEYGKAYHHFFIFPILFAPIVVFFLVRALMKMLEVFSKRLVLTILSLAAFAALFATISELLSKDWAVWEFRPEAVNNTLLIKDHPIKPHPDNIEGFKEELRNLASRDQWHGARPVYVASFFVQTTMLLALLVAIVRFARKPKQDWPENSARMEVAIDLTAALITANLYLMMRVAYAVGKEAIYGDEDLPASLPVIGGCFIVAHASMAYILSAWFEEHWKAVVAATSMIVSLLSLTVGGETLPRVFHCQTNSGSYLLILGFVLLIILTFFWHEEPPSTPAGGHGT